MTPSGLGSLLSVRERLRAATSDMHEALHRARPFAAIADGAATPASYAATLAFLHRYHSAMAPLCALAANAIQAPLLAEAHEARLDALCADLAHFGIGAQAAAADAHDHDADFCLGALYTVQGSSLGGKLIYRQLDGFLLDDKGRTFFKGTADDGPRWRHLCESLECRGGRLDALVAGAHHGFAQFKAMLD